MVKQLKEEAKVVTADAYILFYSKMTVDEFCRQTLSDPGLWPHIVDIASVSNKEERRRKFKCISVKSSNSKMNDFSCTGEFLERLISPTSQPPNAHTTPNFMPMIGLNKPKLSNLVTLDHHNNNELNSLLDDKNDVECAKSQTADGHYQRKQT